MRSIAVELEGRCVLGMDWCGYEIALGGYMHGDLIYQGGCNHHKVADVICMRSVSNAKKFY